MAQNHTDSRWLTFNQANEIGSRIRKGEHGTPIVFYRLREIDDAKESAGATTSRVIPLLKGYTVFNVSQLETIPEQFVRSPSQPWQTIAAAEQLMTDSGATIHHGGNHAFYRPATDSIQLPPAESFSQAEDYYATALHELVHWTGHPSRLNRVLGSKRDIEAYAYEELVAEIGAAFLCANCNLQGRLNHASYIDSWLDALRRDKRLIFTAAGAAQKAADFLIGVAAVARSVSATAAVGVAV
jgi:antirestriction protein ArdC